jgi:hypothetical protein
MEGHPKIEEQHLDTTAQTFEKLTGLTLVPITYEQVPENVMKHFEFQSSKLIHPKEYLPKNFSKLLTFLYENGDTAYIAEQDKTYDDIGDTERLTYFVDTRDGVMTGYLELRFNLTNHSEYFLEKPFVGFTRTKEFQGEGLGRKRLEIANAYAKAQYGFPLNSDSMIIDKNARKIWESLVEEGKAEKYMEGKNSRYRFLTV